MIPSAPTRRLVHTRSIRVLAYARSDGLWDLEAELVDTKAADFRLATGVRPAGEPVHEMRLTVTIDTKLNVVDVSAESLRVPYPGHCETIEPAYEKLVGLNLLRDFRAGVRERLGGNAGCSHLSELATVLPTAAVQAFAGEVFKTRDSSQDPADAGKQPWQLDRCHALKVNGPAVAQFYPRWHRLDAEPASSDSN
jgi:hypothetical protein